MKEILVTGASGLLGRQVIEDAARAGHFVTALTRDLPSDKVLGVNYIACDFSRPDFIEHLPKRSFSAIYHLSQSRHFREFPNKALDLFSVNLTSTIGLLDFALANKADRFIFASTGGVYQKKAKEIREEDALKVSSEIDPYCASKLAAELIVKSYAKCLNTVILRPFFIYGHRQGQSMLLPRLVKNIKLGLPIYISGKYGLNFNPIHVTDAATALLAILDKGHEPIYNICGIQTVSVREVCTILSSYIGKTPNFQFVEGNEDHLVGCNEMMLRDLHVPKLELKYGLGTLIQKS